MIDHVIEEAAEVTKELVKARRFGMYSQHPREPGVPNKERIRREVDDLTSAIDALFKKMYESGLWGNEYDGQGQKQGAETSEPHSQGPSDAEIQATYRDAEEAKDRGSFCNSMGSVGLQGRRGP